MTIFKKVLTIAAVIIFSILFVVFTKEVAESTIKSINVCINVIIPSMFAFMVISSYILSSGIYKIIFKPLYLTIGRVFNLDEKSFSIFLLSLIGGYPIGIKLIKEEIAQNKNYSAIAEKLVMFCYCISPPFAITMIGLNLYNSFEIGTIIYISNVISCIVIGIILSRIYKLRFKEANSQKYKGGIVDSVNSSSASLFKICSMIVFFNIGIAVVDAVLNSIGIALPTTVRAFLEISNILDFKPEISHLPLVSAISSFGGVCVILQCYAIAEKKIPFKDFILARIPTAILSALVTKSIISFSEISVPTSSGNGNYLFIFSSNKLVVILLIIICTILLQNNEKNFKKG